MNDLTYAPSPFLNADGQKVIFVDFIHAKYQLEFDVATREASVFSVISFMADSEGLAAISINQPVISATLNGRNVELLDQYSPDGMSIFKILSKPVSTGTHVLTVKSELTERGPYGHPITWYSNPDCVECIFNMSDLRRSDGGYLEAFLPSNYNFDHFRMSFSVTILDSLETHSVFSNGTISNLKQGHWKVEYPSFFTSSCPWFHLGPKNMYKCQRDKFPSSDGRKIQIFVYTKLRSQADKLLKKFVKKTKKILHKIETDFGPFPYQKLVVFARKERDIAMEYAGATVTYFRALPHELNHSYFARSIIPVNGDSGWIDEAIAEWWDRNHPQRKGQIQGPTWLDVQNISELPTPMHIR